MVCLDGACSQDDSTGSIGGVLVSPGGRCVSFFASMVPEHRLERLFRLSKNPIHELVVLPVLILRKLRQYGTLTMSRHVWL